MPAFHVDSIKYHCERVELPSLDGDVFRQFVPGEITIEIVCSHGLIPRVSEERQVYEIIRNGTEEKCRIEAELTSVVLTSTLQGRFFTARFENVKILPV